MPDDCVCMRPVKSSDIDEECKRVALGERVLVATQDRLLYSEAVLRLPLSSQERVQLQQYMRVIGGARARNPSMVGLLSDMFNASLIILATESGRRVTVLYDPDKWVPTIDVRRANCLLGTARSCIAYMYTKLPSRGIPCCRGGTYVTPEGYGSIHRTVGPGWSYRVIPTDGHRCCGVLVPSVGAMYFYDRDNGSQLQNGELQASGKCDQPSVVECTYNAATGRVCAYDCMVAAGVDVRGSAHSERMLRANAALRGCRTGQAGVPLVVIEPNSDLAGAGMVLFSKDSAPYATHSGGDAFLWKKPTLSDGQVVVVCRVGRVMAVCQRDECLMQDVGPVVGGKKHMGAYVCERSGDAWRAIRLAKRSERLYTADECAAGGARSQVDSGGLARLAARIPKKN